jgi:hypothetical protein
MKPNPKIVYKYRDWKKPNHKRILLKNELYLSSPKDFNDPFDCRISQNFSLLTPKEEDDYITSLTITGFPAAERMGLNYAEVIKDFENRFKDKKQFQKSADSILFSYQDKHYAVFSCSTRWNSILMWSHYSANHTGFCIGFWYQKLLESRLFGKGGPVNYMADYPKIKPRPAKKDKQLMIDSFTETHTKAKEWHYEKEYRFMTTYPRELTEEDRIVRIPNDFIAEVILGISISDKNKLRIIKICNKKGIPVYQAIKNDFKFRIRREKIKN